MSLPAKAELKNRIIFHIDLSNGISVSYSNHGICSASGLRGKPASDGFSRGTRCHVRGQNARRHHHRPRVGRPLRPADRLAAGGHRLLRQVGRRLPGQYRHRHGAARPEIGAASPASATSRWAASSASSWRARASRLDGIATDPERLTALVLLAVEDEGVSPMIFYRTDCADMALDEDDIDEAFIASARADRRHRHAFLARQHRGRAAQGDPHRQGERRQGGVRHRLPAEPLGPCRPCRGLRALCEVRPRLRAAEDRAARLRPDRRHRGGDHDRLRRRRRARRAEGDPRAVAGDDRAEARRHGLHRL